MAIVKMQKVVLVGPEDRRQWTVELLQDLGVVHVVPLTEEITDPADLSARLNQVRRVKASLSRLEPGEVHAGLTDDEVVDMADADLAKLSELETKLTAVHKEYEQSEPWGTVTHEDLAALASERAHLTVYAVPDDTEVEDLHLDRFAWYAVLPYPARRRQSALAVLSLDEPAALEFETIPLPEKPRAKLAQEMDDLREQIAATEADLRNLAAALDAVERVQAGLEDELAFHRARQSARQDGEIFALEGWCPKEQVPDLAKALDKKVALLTRNPEKDEEPPIALKNGPIVRFFEPLVKMFEMPTYREGDPTVLIAPFMGIFFGFCLGDAGYGLVLFLAALYGEKKFRPKGDGLKVVRFLELLGILTVIIGLLTGMFFGITLFTKDALLRHVGLTKDSLLFTWSSQPDKFFYASLVMGVVQLTFGMLVQLVRRLRREQYQLALSTFGWLMVMPGIAVWMKLHNSYLFLAAIALIFLFSNPVSSIPKRLGTGLWEIYNLSGLFGDVMSYARIFGLGLSSGIIAMVINDIASKAASGGILGWVGAFLILTLGHTFNFAMAVIGALVHPARLQFLEFYGRFFEGGGKPFKPLKRLRKEMDKAA